MQQHTTTMKSYSKAILFIILCFLAMAAPPVSAQSEVESPTLSLNRGKLWQSVFFGKVGPNFSNWGRRGISLDWPGFDESWINQDIGGPASHMVSGGFWVGARKEKHPDSILAVEDWSMYASTVSSDAGAKYIMKRHKHAFGKGGNFWLKTDPRSGEDVLESVWEYNMNYTNIDDRENVMPLRVTRRVHQWSGSQADENYILYEYTFKNISPEIHAADTSRKVADTLYDFYAMLCYGLQVNSRSWRVQFPQLTDGARNTYYDYDPSRNMIIAKADDYLGTTVKETNFSANQGPLDETGSPTGEWIAPGYVGLRLIYASKDTAGRETRVNKFGWSAASNSIDLSGPFTGIGTLRDKYAVIQNPQKAASFAGYLDSAFNKYVQNNRMWSLMSFGPFRILPNDSIVIVIAEIVNGIDFTKAVDKKTTLSEIGQTGIAMLNLSADKAKFTYDQKRKGNGFNHPDPPPAPDFQVDYYRSSGGLAANVITWGDEYDDAVDPDDGVKDLAGYYVYRSGYLPIGPWFRIDTVLKKDANNYNPATRKYTALDSTATIGTAYYYSITAFDTGRTTWNIDPTVNIPETRSRRVPALESSVFANRQTVPFVTTFAPAKTVEEVIVVPNPFVLGDKYSALGSAGTQDNIQFVKIPNPCTIRIYTIRGDLVKTINVPEGAGAIASWDQVTDYGQFVESGVYIFHLDSPQGKKIGKFAIVR